VTGVQTCALPISRQRTEFYARVCLATQTKTNLRFTIEHCGALEAKSDGPLIRLFVRDRRGRVVHVPVSDITQFVGADDYVEVLRTLANITLADFERRLDPKRFRRIHRSVMLNLDKVVACKPIDRRLRIELSDGSQ